MSFAQWINWLQQGERTVMVSFIALALFLVLYIASRRNLHTIESARLDHIKESLHLYLPAMGPLLFEINSLETSTDRKELLLNKLLACRAAPYITPDLLSQIDAYIHDTDRDRLPLLYRTLDRECEHLIEERENLLNRIERPNWGQLLWGQIRHIVPFLFASALLCSIVWLIGLIKESISGNSLNIHTLLNDWSALTSVLFSLLILYPVMTGSRRSSESRDLFTLWSILIALISLVNYINLEFALYVFGSQLLLFIVGFFLTGNKSRKSRPFAGHYFQDNLAERSETTLTEPEPPRNNV